MLLFNGESVPIALGRAVSNGFWFLVINVVSNLCFSVVFRFGLFSFLRKYFSFVSAHFRCQFLYYSYRLVSSTFPPVFTI